MPAAPVLRLAFIVMYPTAEPLPDNMLSRVRVLHQEFFDRFPDNTRFRRIPIGEDFTGLAEFLRATVTPQAEQLTDLARRVWLGIYPQGVLADVTGRSYAEVLIKRVVGCLVAATADPALAATEQDAARAACDAGAVVIDTTALTLLDYLDEHARRLVAQFARVLYPATCRDDVLEARNSLALRSNQTLGWNLQAQKPQLGSIPQDVADGWAEAGTRLAQRLSLVEVVQGSNQSWSWNDSMGLAGGERIALWADDLALRHVARTERIPAFGTLDLVTSLVQAGHLPQTVLDETLERFRRAYVVDLPIADRLLKFAAAENWNPDGYAALLLSRPCLWNPPSDGFAQSMVLMRTLLAGKATPEQVTRWATAAMTGLSWAIPPADRTRAVAGIVAWTVLNGDGAAIFPDVLTAGENVIAAAAPGGDLLDHAVSILTETLGQIVHAEQIGVVFTRLLANFDQPRRARAMRSFLSMSR